MTAGIVGSVLDAHMKLLRRAYPDASMKHIDGGVTLVIVPGVNLPEGWNQKTTTVWFHVPVGYPMAKPDCFWADATLRLAEGGMPQSSGVNAPAGHTQPLTWFSWHVQPWNPVGDTLLTYVRVIQDRFLKRN